MSRWINIDDLPNDRVEWDDIFDAPSIDIVRCGECKMWMSEHLCQWWSRYGTVETDADDFCSYGERENDE